jgi:hypothetical protein
MTGNGSRSSSIGKKDFNECIPDTIERLTREHRNFESRLNEADNSVNR